MDHALWRQLVNRPEQTHKYDYGHVLVIGGSSGMEGAPLLVAEAALRMGAGLVTIATTEAVADRIAGREEEIMVASLLCEGGDVACSQLFEYIKQRLVTVVVIGSGLTPEYDEAIRQFLRDSHLPTVVDARALRALRGYAEVLDEGSDEADFVLTPHTGEFADLIGEETVGQEAAKEFAMQHHVTVVLKGNPTFIAAEDKLFTNTTNTPALATAGTGDVLAGIIAGIIAQGIEVFDAARMGVYIHGLAGQVAASKGTEPTVIAGDVIAALPQALQNIIVSR